MGCESVASQCCDDWCRTTPAAEQATHGHIAERLCAGCPWNAEDAEIG